MSEPDERLGVQVRADEVIEVSGAGLTLALSLEDGGILALVFDDRDVLLGSLRVMADAVEVVQPALWRGTVVEWEVGG